MASCSPSFCSKCGFSLENNFKFCPKCGIKVRFTSAASTADCESTPPAKFSLQNFQSFKSQKESERSSFFVRKQAGKKKRKVEVKHIPGIDPEEPFTLRRFKEESGFGYARITLYLLPQGDVFEELREYLDEKDDQLYGFASSGDDEDLIKPTFDPKPSSSSGDVGSERAKSISVSTANSPAVPSSIASGVGAGDHLTRLVVNCPTCWGRFPIDVIEEHADMCAQSVEELPDPHPTNSSSSSSTGAIQEQGELKEEISNLAGNIKEEEVRVTVRRNHLWWDFTRARNDYYSPLNAIKITFSGEPAIDDGGPKREFLYSEALCMEQALHSAKSILVTINEMLEFCNSRLFPDGFPTQSVLAVAKDDFVTAGEVMAMSIAQGGPCPNFLAPEIYSVLSRSFVIEDLKDESLKETCLKLTSASEDQLSNILMEDRVLDTLQHIGYNGVPTRENKESIKRVVEAICMYDQSPPGSMSSIVKLEEGLKTYGLLKSIREHPLMWKPVFVPGEATGNRCILPFHQLHSIIGYRWFTNNPEVAVGASTILPLGLPKKISIQFLHGCAPGCRCRPTTSTCSLTITIPTHLDNEDDMKSIMASAVADSQGFQLV
ncbi:hypothetical protein OS493_018422 [Desmophyllum pertusum]|uniref:G2 M phase-specific E3 ubiquitin- ligase-like n=1 Tax=Desmophyllum pertusum TaxID=174260 RepID=A0A9X0DAY0_9CNID|nr:hypothetical protein OS493_018422 [Desmophyllum pertusum]